MEKTTTQRKGDKNEHEPFGPISDVPIPLFEWIRVVNVEKDGIMRCSCFKYENSGIFCEHQCSVAELVYKMNNKTFTGFTHHDVALRYVTSYMHLAFRNTTGIIDQMYSELAKSDIEDQY